MKFNDAGKPPFEGYFKVERSVNGSDWQLEEFSKNLVVNRAAWILRDMMFGDQDKMITKVLFGDMGLDPETDNVRDVDDPQPTDEGLTNKLYEKSITKRKVTYEGAPAVEYTVILEEDEFNGTGTQLITEYALGNESNEIFARKTRAAVYKDNESSLRFTWTLVFN